MNPTTNKLFEVFARLPGAFLDTLAWGVHHPGTVAGGCVIAALCGISGYLATRRPGRK